MSKIADAEANATSLDSLVNDNALVTTLRNGPKKSWLYMEGEFDDWLSDLKIDGQADVNQVVSDLEDSGNSQLTSLMTGIQGQANDAISDIHDKVDQELEQVTNESDAVLNKLVEDSNSAIESAQERTDAAVNQLTNDANYLLDSIEYNALSRSKISIPVTLTEGQTEITIDGFNASMSAYYVKDVNGDSPRYRLFSGADEDYIFENETTSTITLNQTYDAGTKIYAASLDPAGSGVVKAETQFESIIDLRLSDIAEGAIATIPSLGGARYLIKTGVDAEIGDVEFTDARVGVLMEDDNGAYDCRWFGVVDDPDNQLGSQIELLRNAAQRAALALGTVVIPNIKINVSGSPIREQVTWTLYQDTAFDGLPGVPPSFTYDLTQLGGKVIVNNDSASTRGNMFYYGDGGYAVQKITGRSPVGSVITGASPNASGGLSGITNSKPATDNGQGTIALRGVAVNDNTNPDLIRTTWGAYIEAYNTQGTKGVTQGTEIACINKNPVVANYTPETLVNDQREGLFMGLWVGCGIGEDSDEDVSVAIALVSDSIGNDPAKFSRGLVFKEGCTRTGEVIAASANDQIAWYDTRSSGNGKQSYIQGATTSSNRGRIVFGTRNLPAQPYREYNIDREGISCTDAGEANIGSTSLRFKTGYFVNSPNVVSDRDKKTEIRGLTSDELSAGLELARNVQFFKWIDEVNEKGSDNSYLHASVIAQEAYDILTNNNLDASKYGLVSNQSGNWSVLPTELNMLMSAALVAEQDNIKSRLEALEV